MSPTLADLPSIQERLGLADGRLYLVVALLVSGNVALPFAFHQIPNGGTAFLPIFFFTLIAGWRFGLEAGLMTALLSPLTSHLLTGMPPTPVLLKVIAHSALLGGMAALGARWGRRISPLLLTLVVLAHQALILTPAAWTEGFQVASETLGTRWPGLALQVIGGFLVLRALARFLPMPEGPAHGR